MLMTVRINIMGLPSIFGDITDIPDISISIFLQYFFNIKSIFLLIWHFLQSDKKANSFAQKSRCECDARLANKLTKLRLVFKFWLVDTLKTQSDWERFWLKTSKWNEYLISWMIHSTYVISLSPQAKWHVLIWFKYLIPLTCLKLSQ